MAGIKELSEALNATFDIADEGLKIRKSGVQSAMGDIFALYSSVQAGVSGGDQIAAEAEDLDDAEVQELAKLVATRLNQTLLNAGVKPDSRAAKTLAQFPRILSLAEHNYVESKAIYEALK